MEGWNQIGFNVIIKLTMFNRHIYERYEQIFEAEKHKQEELAKSFTKRRKQMIEQTEHYKARVRDFFVQMASKPLELGQYIPPVKHITRKMDQTKNLANAQLYINGFKTNKERLERAVSENKVLDYTPIPVSALNHQFKSRCVQKEMQPGMRFQGNNSPKNSDLQKSRESKKLPPISRSMTNPEIKMHFKALQEMGNKLQSMRQRQVDRIGLMNKLQTVFGGGDINLQKTSLDVLQKCKLNRSKTLKTIKSTSLKSLKTDI